MTPLESSHPSRRQMMEQLSTLLGGAALGPLAGCSSSKQSKEGSSTETVDEDSMDPPKIDMAAMSDALGLALAALPMGTDADALLANVQAEIDALHAAGLTETAQWYTSCVDDVFTPMVGNLAAVLPANGSADPETAQSMGRELVNSLEVGMAGLLPKLDEVSEELTGALDGDTSEPSPEAAKSLAEHEVALREWMHAMKAGDGNLSGQAVAMTLVNQMQAVRAKSVEPLSVQDTVEQMKAALGVLGADETTAAGESSTRRKVQEAAPPTWRRHGYEGAPPPDLELECKVANVIRELLEATINIVGTIQSMSEAARVASQAKWRMRASDLEWEVERADLVYLRTFRIDLTGIVKDDVLAALESLWSGSAQEGWAASVEEECNWYAGFFLTILLLVQIAQALIMMFGIISKLGAQMALATGAYAPAPLLAGAIIFILMLAVIMLYVLNVVCMVIELLPALEAVFLQCEE